MNDYCNLSLKTKLGLILLCLVILSGCAKPALIKTEHVEVYPVAQTEERDLTCDLTCGNSTNSDLLECERQLIDCLCANAEKSHLFMKRATNEVSAVIKPTFCE